MNFKLYENIEIISSLKKESILSRISGQLEYTTLFGNAFHKKSWKKYEGFVDNSGFKFRRILKYGANSFILIVQGGVKQTTYECIIRVKLRLHNIVYILLGIITLISLSIFFMESGWTEILFVLFPYLFCLFFYYHESKLVKDDLKSFLKE